jgi:L-ascorbate metabolism protein UlaG (beta-lactamase superfamily)
MSNKPSAPLSVRLIGGPTAVIEMSGLRLLTDPTFDEPRSYPRDETFSMVKHRGPAVPASEIGPIDAVLLSHDEHPDNLDISGRAFLRSAPRVLTTPMAAHRLGGTATGLMPYELTELPLPDGCTLRVTALPAQHGPAGAEAVTGQVTGFLLEGPSGPSVYVSGDNASVEVVTDIVAEVGPPEISILFVGGASVPFLFDGEFVTLSAARAAQAAAILRSRTVIPIHLHGWSHYTESSSDVSVAFAAAGMDAVLRMLEPGQTIAL